MSITKSNRERHLGKPNPSFEKRLREHKKREKRAEKARRKAERVAAKKLDPDGEVGPDGEVITDGEVSADESPSEPGESTDRPADD